MTKYMKFFIRLPIISDGHACTFQRGINNISSFFWIKKCFEFSIKCNSIKNLFQLTASYFSAELWNAIESPQSQTLSCSKIFLPTFLFIAEDLQEV